jgi:hypothetical protein
MRKSVTVLIWLFSAQVIPGQPAEPVLSPAAAEAARLIGVGSLVEELGRLPAVDSGGLRALAIRQEITDAVLAASLEADGVVAEIDNEWAQARDVRSSLESRRDRRIVANTVANILIGGGMGVTGSLVQLKNNNVGNILGAAAGGTAVVLSLIAMRQQKGGEQRLGIAPNMLAKIFGRTAEFHSDYPEVVWTYLNSVPPAGAGPETRRARLIQYWTELGRISSESTPEGRHKIDLLTSSVSGQKLLSIDVLSERAMMLSDVRAQVQLLKRDLGRLMRYLVEERARQSTNAAKP